MKNLRKHQLVRAKLTRYLPMVLVHLRRHLANEYEIMAAKEKHCPRIDDHILGSPGGTPEAIATEMRDEMSGTDSIPCTEF